MATENPPFIDVMNVPLKSPFIEDFPLPYFITKGPGSITSQLLLVVQTTTLNCARDRFCNQQLKGPKSG